MEGGGTPESSVAGDTGVFGGESGISAGVGWMRSSFVKFDRPGKKRPESCDTGRGQGESTSW